MTDPTLEAQRRTISELGRRMLADGLTRGTGGNVSARSGNAIAISPSGVPYDEIDPEDVVVLEDDEVVAGTGEPSSEYPMHSRILAEREDVGAVVHTHSPYASTFASLGEPVPASHYLIAFVGDRIPVAAYEKPGTAALADSALDALGEAYNACLLANHGVVATGASAEAAYEVALMVEYCARIHYQALGVGEPVILDGAEIDNLIERFAGYGQASDSNAAPEADATVSEARLADLEPLRAAVSEYGREMLDQGLTTGTGGNISAQDGDLVAISPSGMPYDGIDPEDVPLVELDGGHVAGDRQPSSEFRMHTGILAEREDAGAVVHTHSPYASTFASLGEPVPASHYLVAFAGREVPVAGYATYGTQELADLALDALGEDHDACLLQNHGVVALGADVGAAFEVALMVEYCARIHYQACNVGDPVVLPDEEVDRLVGVFEEYGQH
jgi:L-fuculose-phosphate aldolase